MSGLESHQTEVLGVYALGALDEQETAEVREHLARCAECRCGSSPRAPSQ